MVRVRRACRVGFRVPAEIGWIEGFFRVLDRWGGIVLLGIVLTWTAAWSASPDGPTIPPPPFAIAQVTAARTSAGPSRGLTNGNPCFLVILVDAQGFDYASPAAFFRTMRKHPHGDKHERTVGHSWLILHGPLTLLEGGHTADFDAAHPNYSATIAEAVRQQAPDPLACLWTNGGVGRFEIGSGGHKPSAAVRFELTTAQYEAVRACLDHYDFTTFDLQTHVCTHFVTRAAACAGITLGHLLTLNLPQHAAFMNREITWWTDPAYSHLTFGSPDVLEKSLALAVKQGLGRDVLKDYRH